VNCTVNDYPSVGTHTQKRRHRSFVVCHTFGNYMFNYFKFRTSLRMLAHVGVNGCQRLERAERWRR